MHNVEVPALSEQEISAFLERAAESARRRIPLILHAPGDELNRVVNFILHDSYMQPHLHPGAEKIEKIHLMSGSTAILLFDDAGNVSQVVSLQREGDCFDVPAFTWHTYVMRSPYTITYETMMGEYDPQTWKRFAEWAPREDSPDALGYLHFLKDVAERAIGRGETFRG